ncbi:MAG: hypothetical protein GX801_11960, partial [Fibrobacter sp.]|nr:hypothetical protein [Fibrobacter sp.]
MKDTRMLAETWVNGFNENNWDKVFPKHSYNGIRNNSVSQRCWLTMAQTLNHHKGGNLSSDEILYFVRNGFRDVSGGGPIETMQAVNYALGLDVWDQIAFTLAMNTFSARGIIPELNGWSVGPLLTHTIVKTINSGNVLGVSQLNAGASGAHSMVLNGYRINGNGNFYIHLLNTDNMGGSEWRYYSNIAFLELDVFADFITNGFAALADALAGTNLSNNMFFSYYIPPPFVTGRSANPSVFIDTDGDGIVDFDEIKRFDTDPLNPDTDRDGISDYQEILDYKKCETYSNTFAPIIIRTLSPDSYDTINTPQ